MLALLVGHEEVVARRDSMNELRGFVGSRFERGLTGERLSEGWVGLEEERR